MPTRRKDARDKTRTRKTREKHAEAPAPAITFNEHVANFVLGNVKEKALIVAATAALLEGHDTRHLRMLAAEDENKFNVFEVRSEFKNALAEMGLSLPSKKEAATTLIRFWCRQIVDGKVDPYDGAGHIRWGVYDRVSGLGEEKCAGDALGIATIVGPHFQICELKDGVSYEFKGKKLTRAEAERSLRQHIVVAATVYLSVKSGACGHNES
ncbi:MAG: hypothetical protein RDV41_11590 [Planctomycetota bacterium]|nr:hypothetical protein [Planctomycetota bacterium]